MMRDFPFPLVTTQWVLAELGNFLCDRPARNQLSLFVSELENDPDCEIRTADDISFRAGLDLYTRRPDKEWPFIDCTSIAVMESLFLTDVLTVDHHFQQAGFNVLLP